MELEAKKPTFDNFGQFGTVLNPYDCGQPINPGLVFPYYNDRIHLSFNGGNLTTLNIQISGERPLNFDVTEMHKNTEELFGGFNKDIVFHVGLESDDLPDFLTFEAFILEKYHWVRLKRRIFHWAAFNIEEGQAIGWYILPPFTAFSDTFSFNIAEAINIKL